MIILHFSSELDQSLNQHLRIGVVNYKSVAAFGRPDNIIKVFGGAAAAQQNADRFSVFKSACKFIERADSAAHENYGIG